MKIRSKLLITFFLFTLFIIVLFFSIELRSQNEHFNEIALENIMGAHEMYQQFQEQDIRMLSSVVEVIAQDPGFRKIYLTKDRKKLYDYGQPLFRNLKERFGVTHWYFILPDGHVFLRLHEKQLYGDLVKRTTYQQARDTKKTASGIELGETAFALRAVTPYYHAGELIGYLELGQEIDHFLKALKTETNNDFEIIGEKKYLDRGNWRSTKRAAGLRDNWPDMQEHVVISNTADGKAAGMCFSEENVERVEKGEHIFQKIRDRDRTLMCGGFEMMDAGKRHVGAVLSLIDISDHVAAADKINRRALVLAFVLFLATSTAGVLISRSISNPMTKLKEAAKEIGKGNLEVKIDVASRDEIGALAYCFNRMTEDLRKTTVSKEALEVIVEKRTGQLRSAQEELVRKEKLATLGQVAGTVGHELRNPLGIMNNAVYFLQTVLTDANETTKEYLDIIKSEIASAERIVSDLLDAVRTKPPRPQCVPVDELIRTSLDKCKPAKNITVDIQAETQRPVSVDPLQLKQVFINLSNNAFDAMSEGGALRISACENRESKTITISFEDEGAGIPPEHMAKLFQPLFTTKARGIGLGLVVVKNLTEANGGKVGVQSEVGKGTVFTISLPAGGA